MVSGLVAIAAFTSVGCSATKGAAPLSPLSAAAPEAVGATTHLTQTTLALGIGDAAEARSDEAKADEPSPLPTTCGGEATIKDAKLCLPEATIAKKLCTGNYPEVALGPSARARRGRASISPATSRPGTHPVAAHIARSSPSTRRCSSSASTEPAAEASS